MEYFVENTIPRTSRSEMNIENFTRLCEEDCYSVGRRIWRHTGCTAVARRGGAYILTCSQRLRRWPARHVMRTHCSTHSSTQSLPSSNAQLTVTPCKYRAL